MSFSKSEVVFEHDDNADSVYFISNGVVILYVDMLSYVDDPRLKFRVQMFERRTQFDQN